MEWQSAIRKRVATIVALMALVATPAAMAQTAQLGGVQTSVDLDLDFVGALVDLGVAPAPIFPGTLVGTTASFPIPGGAVDLSDLRGDIFHTGGLSLTAGETTVQLLNFVIDTTGPAELTGIVAVNGSLVDRLPLFDLDLTDADVNPGAYNTLAISNVSVTLSAEAADALNMVFGIDALFEGLPIGVATVLAQAFGGDDGSDDEDGDGNDEGDDEDGDRRGWSSSTVDDRGKSMSNPKLRDVFRR